jgi:hypothetical protein
VLKVREVPCLRLTPDGRLRLPCAVRTTGCPLPCVRTGCPHCPRALPAACDMHPTTQSQSSLSLSDSVLSVVSGVSYDEVSNKILASGRQRLRRPHKACP